MVDVEAVKSCPRGGTLMEYQLLGAYEYYLRVKCQSPSHLRLQVYHLIRKAHQSYIINTGTSPWTDQLELRPKEVPELLPEPVNPHALPAPDEDTALPEDLTPKQCELARQVLGFFWQKKPVQIHNIIRAMAHYGVEDVSVRNVVSVLKKAGLLDNPSKGVYERVEVADASR
jgi:hypothetical protein